MGFNLKIAAKEQIKGNYLVYSSFAALYILLNVICTALTVALIVFAVRFFMKISSYTAVLTAGIAASLLLMLFLKEIFRVFLCGRYSDCEPMYSKKDGIVKCALKSLVMGCVISIFKTLWTLLFLTPFFLAAGITFLLSDAGVLYHASVSALTAVCGVLFVTGIFFAYAVNSKYIAVRFSYIVSDGAALREIIKKTGSVQSGLLFETVKFRLTMIPWGLLCLFLPACFYCFAYIMRCRMNLAREIYYMLPTSVNRGEEEIKIYLCKKAQSGGLRKKLS